MATGLEKYTNDQLLQVLKKDIGFRFDVPDILTFIDDEYYMGWKYWNKNKNKSGVYPFWREKLKELYPNPITTKSSYVVVTGCIGSGKSTFSTIMMLYDYCKLIAMENPGSFFDLLNINGIRLFGASIHKYKAEEFIEPINEMLEKAPFIQDLKKSGQLNTNIRIEPAYSVKSIVSTDAAVIWLSEVNEYKEADALIASALSRMQGRFQKGMGTFCHFILDCSDTTVDSPTMRFTHKSAYSSKVFLVQPNIWTVKPWLYGHCEPKTFKVYGGDAVVSPHVLTEGEDTTGFDESRIIDVPMELYPEFCTDVQLALKEKAGLALIAGGMFFPETFIKDYFSIKPLIKDVEVVDFYDESQVMDLDGMSDMIDAYLPEDKYVFVGLDCGYATDEYGIAVGYAESVSFAKIENNLEEKVVQDFYIKIPIVFGLGRKKGQTTNISKVRNFLFSLNERHPIHTVCYDSFQTEQLAQEMRMLKINTRSLSVETDKYYLPFKHALCEGKLQLPDNNTLYREFKCLKLYDDHKVDHSNVEALDDSTTGDNALNAKDMCDAVVRCFSMIRHHLGESMDIPLENTEYHSNYWMEGLQDLGLMRQERMNYQRFAQRVNKGMFR
ncbi:MAG: hypothetical protein MJZ34_02740 [Paludibacteraceae bacterium]|nr:hypothetical protein [Paludibacteraceae bacterium]